jgi:hypothetical protein
LRLTINVILIFTLAISQIAPASELTYELKDDLLITTVGSYVANIEESRRICKRLPSVFSAKLTILTHLLPEARSDVSRGLSDEEFEQLFGDAPGFVVQDFSTWYSRSQRGQVGLEEFFDIGKLNRTNEYDDILLVCGHNLNAPKTVAAGASTKPHDIADYYLVDRHGVDRITSGGWSLRNGDVIREFGTLSAFMPGDKTREVGWRAAEQTLLVYESIKHTRTGGIETIRKDAMSLAFEFDSEATQAAGGVVVLSASEPPLQGGPKCVKWQREMSPANCTENRESARRFFMTQDLGQAKKIFKALSPEAKMVGLDDSSTNCVSGSICEHPGGAYVDAIIRGDMEGFRQLDIGASGFLRDKIDELGIVGEVLFAPHFDDETLSPFDSFIVEYLHEYKKNPTHCFKPGSQSLDFKGVTEKLVEVDGMGNRTGHTYGGITMTSHYKINPEFFGICRQVCGLRNGGTEQLAGSTPVLLAARKFRETYDCKSKEVQDFERNLIDFYGRKSEVYEFEVTRNSW